MFQDIYKSAYQKVTVNKKVSINETQIGEWMEKKSVQKKRSIGKILRPAAVAVLTCCLMIILGVPVAAKSIPGFYAVLERNAPALVDYLIPVQQTDSSRGIIMNLEAAKIEGSKAEVLVSFSDEEGNDYIHGMADMYDSYYLYSYSGDNNIGGCSFIEYNEEEDKAYFQIDLISSEGVFDPTRMEFGVRQLLTDCQKNTQEIPLENISRECKIKTVSLNGGSGGEEVLPALKSLTVSGNETDPRPGHLVMDVSLKDFSSDTMEITAKAYVDGILRIQLLRGNFKDADRHMKLYMLNEQGKEVYPELSVMWHDEIDGEEVLVEELYFVITEEQLAEYTLWGESDIRAGNINGNWNIIFDIK